MVELCDKSFLDMPPDLKGRSTQPAQLSCQVYEKIAWALQKYLIYILRQHQWSTVSL